MRCQCVADNEEQENWPNGANLFSYPWPLQPKMRIRVLLKITGQVIHYSYNAYFERYDGIHLQLAQLEAFRISKSSLEWVKQKISVESKIETHGTHVQNSKVVGAFLFFFHNLNAETGNKFCQGIYTWQNAVHGMHHAAYLHTKLTHWGPDKMAVIFQTTFSSAFSWLKMYEFRLRLVQLTIFQHWFR